jgi:hypothetical protein
VNGSRFRHATILGTRSDAERRGKCANDNESHAFLSLAGTGGSTEGQICVTPIVVIATLVLLGSTGKNEVGRPEAPPTGSSTGAADLGQRAAPVELRISPAVVEIKHMPRATLVNTGNATVQSSHIFKLERKTIAGWRWINRRQAWRLPVLFLEPGRAPIRSRSVSGGPIPKSPGARERSDRVASASSCDPACTG